MANRIENIKRKDSCMQASNVSRAKNTGDELLAVVIVVVVAVVVDVVEAVVDVVVVP
jgi:hypothetical protein